MAEQVLGRQTFVWAAGIAALFSALFVQSLWLRLGLFTIGATLMALLLVLWLVQLCARGLAAKALRQIVILVAHEPTPCFVSGRHGQILYLNKAAQQRLGYSRESLLIALQDHFASPASVLLRLQVRAQESGSAREDVASRRGLSRIAVHHIASGQYLWRLDEFIDASGQGRGAESIGLPMLVANKAGVILFANEAMRRVVGGRPRRLDQVVATPHVRSGEEVTIYGIEGPLRAVVAELEGQGQKREIYLLPTQNVSDDPNLRADFESVPVALLRFRPDGELIVANRAARDILNLPSVKDQGKDCRIQDLYEGLGRSMSDLLADIMAERISGSSEVLRARLVPQADRFHQVTLRRIVEQGQPGVLAVVQDATAMKQLEAQFVQSQKMQAVGQLVGGIAHDFNNLLTAITGHCDLLLLRRAAEDKDYADLTQIAQNANRAAALVRQLLAFSRKQTLKPERIDLQDVFSEMMHLLSRLVGEKVRVNLTLAPNLDSIRADKRQLEQVLMNLVVNARDAMPGGGVIEVSAEVTDLREDLCRDRARVPVGRYAVIHVRDAGCGIPADRIDHIFEPFYTTKRVGEGTGLGLSTVYGIVKQSGGFVFVDSELGRGSVFHLYFPIHAASDEDQLAPPLPKRDALKRQDEGVVLLVEDEAPVRAFASRGLRLRGYTVLEAESAEEALDLLKDPSLEIDVFVTDVVMPGMDGPSWVRLAHEQRPEVRVVFMSGYAEDCLSEAQGRVANSVFLPKPFSLSDLAHTLQDQMH